MMKGRFTNQKARYATEKDLKAPWSFGKNGKYFKCGLCGYKFKLGDYWRWIYMGDVGKELGKGYTNFITCKLCDDNPKEKAIQQEKDFREFSKKYWRFLK